MRKRRWFLAGVLAPLLLCAPAWALPDHTSFDLVLGQKNKGLRRGNRPDTRGLSAPIDLAIDRAHTPNHLYLSDATNSRILAWRDVSQFQAGTPPDLIIGQPDGETAERFRRDDKAVSGPLGLSVDKDGTLWTTDQGNGRILGFSWPFDPGQSQDARLTADYLIGQPDFGIGYLLKACNGGGLHGGRYGGPVGPASDSMLCDPTGLTVDPQGNLYVADARNSRVLVFRVDPRTGKIPPRGARATLVFGQTGLTTVAGIAPCNKGVPLNATSLCRPGGVFFHQDGATPRLYVADTGNHRVLVYDDPLADQTADRVFGQPDMISGLNGIGPERMNGPLNVAIDDQGTLWVSDSGLHRVLGFSPPFSIPAEYAATYVLGQADTNSGQPNRGIAGRAISLPTANTLNVPRGMAFDGKGRMLLVDQNNHRVLSFTGHKRPAPAALEVVGQADAAHGAENLPLAKSLSAPVGMAIDRPDPRTRPNEPIHVYVTDFGNSRVLGWWDLGDLKDGKPADLLIGQLRPTDYACNMGRGTSKTSLCWPRGVFVDKDGDLWVADTFNHRVLRFPRPFAGPAVPVADLVLGQSSFFVSQQNRNGGRVPSASSLWHPGAIAVAEDGMVWVADRDNDRVVAYQKPYGNGIDASRLLGAPNFTTLGCPVRPAGTSVCGPTAVALDQNDNLWVAERDHHRVALYNSRLPGPSPVLSGTALAILGQPNQAGIGANAGMGTGGLRNNTLWGPEGVSVELVRQMDGTKIATAIVVADTQNNRVLAFDPIVAGFQPAARQVYGQADKFDQDLPNLGFVGQEQPQNLMGGLWSPAAVVAIPEALLISESGASSNLSTRANLIPSGQVATSNNRVLLVRGPGFPGPSTTPWQAPDGGGVFEEADLFQEEGLDMAVPEAADLALAAADLASVSPPIQPPAGCSCNLSAGAAPPLSIVVLVGLLLGAGGRFRRRRRKA